ncbi:MAG: glycosyltransferase [Candidatus Glassbacteria bacterium]
MRLIHLTTSGGWGGREMYPLALAENQARRGHTVSVVAKRNTPLAERLSCSGLDHDLLRVGPYFDPAACLTLARVIRRRNPDILHLHLSRDLLLAHLACLASGRKPPVLLHKHIASAGNKRDPLHRWLFGRTEAVVAVSGFVRTSLLNSCPVGSEKVRVIFNGVDPVRFTADVDSQARTRLRREIGAESPEAVVAGVVGRVELRKGQEWFVEAAGLLAGSHPDLRFAIAGAPEGDYEQVLCKRIEALGLSGRVTLLGHRPDPRTLYGSLDILVVPSWEEAFGLVAAEGMLCSLPVVASDSGALPEFIQEGVNGFLVPLKDARSLAGVIGRLADDPELRRNTGDRARQWAQEHLDLEVILNRLDWLYEECAKK